MHSEDRLDDIVEECQRECASAQIGDELRRFVSLINRLDIHSIVEIGSEEGGTIRLWTKLFRPLRIFNIDMNSYERVKGQREALEAKWQSWLAPDQTLDTIWGNSHDPEVEAELYNRMLRYGLQQVDMVFIDGDHSEFGAEQDHNMYGPLVRKGGIIAHSDMHPYKGRESGPQEETVWKFWERLKGPAISQWEDRSYHKGLRPNWLEICHDCQNQQSFGFGIIFV